MKLNMGCGQNQPKDYVNVDKYAECEPDQVVDLEQFPWPWADDSIDGVLFNHSLEHMGADVGCFLKIMQELWRVCRDGATVEIYVPHPRHNDFICDPTHVRAVTPEVLSLFDLQYNLQWKSMGAANTPLALYTGTDFRLTKVNLIPDSRWQEKLDSGQIDTDGLMEAAANFNNVISSYELILQVRKSRTE